MHARKKAGTRAPRPDRQRRTQVERRATSEQRILDAAMRLIARKGVERLTLADVGAEAGYSRGLPAHLFGNKEGLLVSVVDHFIRMQTETVLRQRVPGHGPEAVCAAIREWAGNGVRDPEIFRTYQVLIGEASCGELKDAGTKLRGRVQVVNRHMRQHVQQQLERGKAAGEICADVDPFQTALQIISTLRGLVSIWLIDPKGIDFPEAIRHYLHDLALRLQPRASVKKRTPRQVPAGTFSGYKT